MTLHFNVIQRKALYPHGRLGSFYDAISDRFSNEIAVQPSRPPLWHRFRRRDVRLTVGDRSKTVYDYLRLFGVDVATTQSILVGLVETTGMTMFVNHKQPIDETTLLLHFCYYDREDQWQFHPHQRVSVSAVTATHFITKIVRGFEILFVTQLSDIEAVKQASGVLKKIFDRILEFPENFRLSFEERILIRSWKNTFVYGSDQCFNQSPLSLPNIIELIPHWMTTYSDHLPISYTMQSLNVFALNQEILQRPFPLAIPINEFLPIEKKILEIESVIDRIRHHLDSSPSQSLEKYFSDLLRAFERYRRHLKNILIDRRRGLTGEDLVENIFHAEIDNCRNKIELIKTLEAGQIQYYDAQQFREQPILLQTIDHLEQSVLNHFRKKTNNVILWFTTDRLRRETRNEWDNQYELLTTKSKQSNPKIDVTYIDCTNLLCRMEKSFLRTVTIEPPEVRTDPSIRLAPIRMMNILFLGETGVGKSTFINAFVNYLAYETFDEAEKQKIVAAIPASFITTVGFHFDEVKINIGDPDPNENFNEQGASVTQHCRSYIIRLRSDLHLRLIDTPGMGDTRGIEQDMKNIDHILTYVDQFSHLDAICFLLKPDVSRLNIFFRSCLKQLFTYLTPQAYENIAFCFTNTRSTFYAPGNTGPILRKLLSENEWNGIAFGKENTFCFDSESFRYLAACRQGVPFDPSEREDFVRSWNKSLAESGRLLEFIEDRKAYPLQEWRSPKRLSLELRLLAWPLMEQLRLMIYNMILHEQNINDHQIIFNISEITLTLCSQCAKKIIGKVGPFVVLKHAPIRQGISSISCACSNSGYRLLIECFVEHRYVEGTNREDFRRMFDDYQDKYYCIGQFIDEINAWRHESNPFKQILEQFIEEEREILSIHSVENRWNGKVLEKLMEIRENEKKLKKSTLVEIEKVIDEVMSFNQVKFHVEKIKRTREKQFQMFERLIQLNLSENESSLRPIDVTYF